MLTVDLTQLYKLLQLNKCMFYFRIVRLTCTMMPYLPAAYKLQLWMGAPWPQTLNVFVNVEPIIHEVLGVSNIVNSAIWKWFTLSFFKKKREGESLIAQWRCLCSSWWILTDHNRFIFLSILHRRAALKWTLMVNDVYFVLKLILSELLVWSLTWLALIS